MFVPESIVRRDKTQASVTSRISFDRIGRNLVAQIRPADVWFLFGDLNQRITRTVRVTNTTDSAIRVTILDPSEPEFELKYTKKGLLASGMSEEIKVAFQPKEFRYYSCTIGVLSSGGSPLGIPIHCIPGTAITVPRFMNLPPCELNQQSTAKISLVNSSPIRLPFTIRGHCQPHEITLKPTSGFIDANGTTEIACTFIPISRSTRVQEMEVFFPHLNCAKRCSISGTCISSKTLEIDEDKTPRLDHSYSPDLSSKRASPSSCSPGTPHSQLCKNVTILPENQIMNGYSIPKSLKTRTSCEYVLKQRRGKLPSAEFVRTVRKVRADHQLTSNKPNPVQDPLFVLNQPTDTRFKAPAFKVLEFLSQCAKIESFESRKISRLETFLGDKRNDEDLIESVTATRKAQYEAFLEDLKEQGFGLQEPRYATGPMPMTLDAFARIRTNLQEGVPSGLPFAIRARIARRFASAGARVIQYQRIVRRMQKLMAEQGSR